MKRFTATEKWDDPWFRALAGAHKLIFLYVVDRCDNAGFWEVDAESVAFHTKLKPEHIEGAWKALERGLKGASGWVWVKNFLKHQKNENLNAENPAHRQIIGLLHAQSERFKNDADFKGAYKGLPSPIGIGKGKGRKGIKGETGDEVRAIYEAYPKHEGPKKAFGKIKEALKAKPFAELLERTQAYAAAVSRWPASENPRFVPLPATWFLQGRYDDDPKAWERAADVSGHENDSFRNPSTFIRPPSDE